MQNNHTSLKKEVIHIFRRDNKCGSVTDGSQIAFDPALYTFSLTSPVFVTSSLLNVVTAGDVGSN